MSDNLLLNAVREGLKKNGQLGHFRAEIRSAVLNVLCDSNKHPKPTIPSETKLINELIKEYLLWNGYRFTYDMLASESGMSCEIPSREYLTTKLGVIDGTDDETALSNKIPLIYYLLASFQNEMSE